MTIGSHDEKSWTVRYDVVRKHDPYSTVITFNLFSHGVYAVDSQMSHDVIAQTSAGGRFVICHGKHRDLASLPQDRHGVCHGARGRAAPIPCKDDAIWTGDWEIRGSRAEGQNRATRPEDYSLNHSALTVQLRSNRHDTQVACPRPLGNTGCDSVKVSPYVDSLAKNAGLASP